MNGGGDGNGAGARTPRMGRIKRKPKLKITPKATNDPASRAVPCNLSDSGEFHFPDGKVIQIRADDLKELGNLGRGTYGFVTKNQHVNYDLIFAVKHIKHQDDPNERKAMMKDLEVNRKTKECPFTVEFYGALFREGEVLICMEVMDVSLEQYYKAAHRIAIGMPRDILAEVSYAVLEAIKFLREVLTIMHRDVKPSNILLANRDEKVVIKLCDFGIAGNLINSLAKTNIGCKPYMAPERIEPSDNDNQGYSVKSDIWSLGISLVEIANGRHPYEGANQFKLLEMVVRMPSPCLDQDDRYCEQTANFASKCLKKNSAERADYNLLLDHEFLKSPRDPDLILRHYTMVTSKLTSQ